MSLQVNTFVSGPLQTNIYLLFDTDSNEMVLIDPSFGNPQLDALVRELMTKGASLKAIWLTHAHLDHWHSSGVWQRDYHPEVFLHKDDKFWTEDVQEQALWLNFPDPDVAAIDHWLDSDQKLTLGQYSFDVLHTPGHSPGSVSFYCAQEDLVISGDVLFAGSAGRTDLPQCDATALQDSLRKLIALPPQTKVLPGHGHATTIAHEAANNPFCRKLGT